MPFLSLECLDPGSGRKFPAIWHGAGGYPLVYPKNLVLKNGVIQPAIILSVASEYPISEPPGLVSEGGSIQRLSNDT